MIIDKVLMIKHNVNDDDMIIISTVIDVKIDVNVKKWY